MQYRIHPRGRVLSRKSGAGRPLGAATLAAKVLGRGRPCRADTRALAAALSGELSRAAADMSRYLDHPATQHAAGAVLATRAVRRLAAVLGRAMERGAA